MRHGKRRGPATRLRALRPAYFDPFLADIATRAPELRRRIDVWETGEPQPALDGVRAILFLLHDPLRELYPRCHEECVVLAERARRSGIRLVNPPEALSNSIKSAQARLWREAGIPTPPHFPFRGRVELERALRDVTFPALLRPDRLHTQQSIRFCRTADEIARLRDDEIPDPGTLTPFVDTREGYRRTAPGSAWATFYHKKRVMIFGPYVRTNHVFFSTEPIVGAKSSTFGPGRRLNPLARLRGLSTPREHFEIDYAYWEQEGDAQNEALLARAARALRFELAAIDYSTFADGTPILWEANPHFSLHLWPLNLMTGRRRLKRRVRSHHDSLARFLEELLTSSEPSRGEPDGNTRLA